MKSGYLNFILILFVFKEFSFILFCLERNYSTITFVSVKLGPILCEDGPVFSFKQFSLLYGMVLTSTKLTFNG